MKGFLLAMGSILLVSVAQLVLRAVMVRLPSVAILLSPQWQQHGTLLLLLCAGLCAYGVSMLCWMLALRYLPLNRLYPLLSLSYVVVWLAAITLPSLGESFRWSSMAGVTLIVCGLLCITLPQRKQ